MSAEWRVFAPDVRNALLQLLPPHCPCRDAAALGDACAMWDACLVAACRHLLDPFLKLQPWSRARTMDAAVLDSMYSLLRRHVGEGKSANENENENEERALTWFASLRTRGFVRELSDPPPSGLRFRKCVFRDAFHKDADLRGSWPLPLFFLGDGYRMPAPVFRDWLRPWIDWQRFDGTGFVLSDADRPSSYAWAERPPALPVPLGRQLGLPDDVTALIRSYCRAPSPPRDTRVLMGELRDAVPALPVRALRAIALYVHRCEPEWKDRIARRVLPDLSRLHAMRCGQYVAFSSDADLGFAIPLRAVRAAATDEFRRACPHLFDAPSEQEHRPAVKRSRR